mgnify:FL=1
MATAKLQHQGRQQYALYGAMLLSSAICSTPAAASEWGGWRDYLAHEITPEYAREASPAGSSVSSRHWTAQASQALMPDFAVDLLAEPTTKASTRLTLSRERHSSSLTQDSYYSDQSTPTLLRDRSLRREFVSPGVIQQLDDNTFLNVAPVSYTHLRAHETR